MNRVDLYHESYRPQFHFTSRTNWMSDPDGLVYYNGEYHLFFQHNPVDNNWGNMTWGHAVSSDLVHWMQMPNAIEPDERGMAFSGSAVVDFRNTGKFKSTENAPIVILYTAAGDSSPDSAGKPYTQCLCFSNDSGRTWNRFKGNPVLPHIVGQNRDPKVTWYEPGAFWLMALYLDGFDFGLFRSDDLRHWTRLQVVTIDGASECPDLFELAVQNEQGESYWVFTTGNGRYVVGSFNGERFVSQHGPVLLDYGPNFHAAQTFSNIPAQDGRRIQLAWMAGGNYPNMPFNQQLTFPCELTLRRVGADLRLCRYPVSEIESLRSEPLSLKNVLISAEDVFALPVLDSLLDISAQIDIGTARDIDIYIHGVRIHCTRQGVMECGDSSAAIDLTGGILTLRVLVDCTSIEIFADDGSVSMTLCYIAAPMCQGMRISASGGDASILDLAVYPLRSIWPNISHS